MKDSENDRQDISQGTHNKTRDKEREESRVGRSGEKGRREREREWGNI